LEIVERRKPVNLAQVGPDEQWPDEPLLAIKIHHVTAFILWLWLRLNIKFGVWNMYKEMRWKMLKIENKYPVN